VESGPLLQATHEKRNGPGVGAVKGEETPYIFFSEHFLAASSHVPPALSQLALSVAFVTSPAKAGPVKARAKATTSVEIRVFMAFLLSAHNTA